MIRQYSGLSVFSLGLISHASMTSSICRGKFLFQLMFYPAKQHIPSLTVPVRGLRYTPETIDVTVDRVELERPLVDTDGRLFKPVKAARTEHSTAFHYDPIVEKFINHILKKGRKDIAKEIMAKTFENIKRVQIEKYHKATPAEREDIVLNPVEILHGAIENCKPLLVLKRVPKGGVVYRVPVHCGDDRKLRMAMMNIITSCRERRGSTPLYDKLTWEILSAFKNEGRAINRKHELHQKCEANRAFAQYRW